MKKKEDLSPAPRRRTNIWDAASRGRGRKGGWLSRYASASGIERARICKRSSGFNLNIKVESVYLRWRLDSSWFMHSSRENGPSCILQRGNPPVAAIWPVAVEERAGFLARPRRPPPPAIPWFEEISILSPNRHGKQSRVSSSDK